MKYQVTIGERVVEVDLTGAHPVVDGHEVEAELVSVTGSSVHHLLIAGRSYDLVAQDEPRSGSWKLTLRGRSLTASVVDERTRAIRELAGDLETEVDKVVHAPMPGLVVRIAVEVGDVIEAGEGVIVVEAMKMENELKAPSSGTVARIDVAPGQPVEKGAVLLVLE